VTPRYVTFSTGSHCLFAIWSGGEKPDLDTPRFSEVGILLDTNKDVEALYEKWKDNPLITIKEKPFDEVFSRTFLVEGADGHIIRVSPID
jgi:hypothetical protein